MQLTIILQQTGGGLLNILPFILMAVIFYFFFMRPQAKRQKLEKKFQEDLKKGDKIVTNTGIHGRVSDISDEKGTIILETLSGKIMFERSAISRELTNARYSPEALEKLN